MSSNLQSFTDVLGDDEIGDSQPIAFPSPYCSTTVKEIDFNQRRSTTDFVVRPAKGTGQYGEFRSVEEIDPKYRDVFAYPFFNLVQSRVIEDALYSDKSIVVCAPTGSGKTVVFEMAIVQLLMEIDDKKLTGDFKIIYMAPVKALCTERLTEWYSKFTKLGLLCIEVTGDTDVDFSQLKPYRVIITTPEKWDMLTRRWRDHKALVEVIKLFLIDEVHILNDETRGPVLEAVVSRMKTIESSAQSAHRIELLQKQYQGGAFSSTSEPPPPRIRFVAVSATVSNPGDVALWLGSSDKPAVYHKFGDECRPVKLKRIVEGYPCAKGSSIFKFDIILNYKLWPIIQKYHDGKPTLIFCNTRKSVTLTAETLSRELTISFSPEQKAKLCAVAATIKNKKLQALVLSGVGCHHAGLLYEERLNIERAFRNRDLPILITTTTLAMGVNLPAHLVIVKNTQQYVNGAYQEYSISTVLQMVGRAGRPQFDTEATAVIMTRLEDKQRYQSLVGGSEPLQSYLHKRLPENLNSEAALGTVGDVAQCVQWLRSTFLYVRAARDPKRYLGLHPNAPQQLISKKIEELCVKAMNGLASSGLISMDEASCIASTEAGRLMSIFYLDLETMKHIMTIEGTESLERLLWIVCESHELADMHLRVDERRCLNALNRNNAATTIRFPMKGKISTRQMKLNCVIQAVLGCLPIPDPALNQEAMKIMRIAERICKCLVAYVTRPDLVYQKPRYYSAVVNALTLAKCVAAHLWENSQYVSKQLKGIGPMFSTLLATAGKVNFRLLEESNPRDLERIINKGAPAGNVIRKQISLLPKYQLAVMPIDEKTVTIQLQLLNQNHLAENIEHLTAGDAHKSYIVVGDSNNKLLLFTCFKDRDLISVYDGCLSYEITRQHNSEYRIYAHCISSSYVGIDDNYEYVFQNLEPHVPQNSSTQQEIPPKKCTKRQTSITDTFTQRKRKNSLDDITQSKEKKKRENALIERFKYLRESFGITSKQLKENLNESAHMSNQIMEGLTQSKPTPSYKVTEILCNDKDTNAPIIEIEEHLRESNTDHNNVEDLDCDEFMDDEKINCILSEIENEISKRPKNLDTQGEFYKKKCGSTSIATGDPNIYQNSIPKKSVSLKKLTERRQHLSANVKSNYNFIDLLERNMDLSDDEPCDNIKSDSHTGFSDAIKEQIGKYLQNAQRTAKTTDISTNILIEAIDSPAAGDSKEDQEIYEEQDYVNLKRSQLCNVPSKHKPKEIASGDDTYNIGDTIKCMEIQLNNIDDTTKCMEMKEIPKIKGKNFEKDQDMEIPNEFCIALNNGKQNNTKVYHELNSASDSDNVRDIATVQKYLNLIPDENDGKCDLFNKEIVINNSIFANENTNLHVNSLTDLANKSSIPTNSRNIESVVSISKKYVQPISSVKHGFNENSQHINKYSFSATKIDVFTNDMNDHRVRVIRKLKLDLGVTEIVTKEKICKGDRAHDVLNKETEPYSNLSIEDFIDDFNQQNTSIHAITTVSSNSCPQSKDKNNAYDSIRNKNQGSNSSKCMANEINKIYEKPEEEFSFSDNRETAIEVNKATGEPNNPSVKEDIEELTQITPMISNYDHKINESPTNNLSNSQNNVENILQKYSQIFSKTNYIAKEIAHTPVVNDNNSNKASYAKPKRPFTIRELPNLKAPIPKTLIDKEPVTNVFPINQIKESQKVKPAPLIIPLLRTKEHTDPLEYTNHNLEEIEDQLDNNEPDVVEFLEIAPYVDGNIDNSMFDPKTLLQCMSEESPEIVPPPPEFGDASPSYSPQFDGDPMDDTSIHNNTSVYEDFKLTPSREIETWTLSRETWEDENLYSEPRTSYTVINKNSPVQAPNKNYMRNIDSYTMPRQARLGQYKFHKNKFKM